MYGLRMLDRSIHPRLHDFKYKETVLGHHARIDNAAFKAGIAFIYQRRSYAFCRAFREPEFLELVQLQATAIAATHDLLGDIHSRNVDDAFAGRFQQAV